MNDSISQTISSRLSLWSNNEILQGHISHKKSICPFARAVVKQTQDSKKL